MLLLRHPFTNKVIFLTCIFCFTIYVNIKAQNLVQNSSFEEFVDFSTNDNSNWHKVQESDTPDYFNFGTVDPYNNIYNKYMGNIAPKTGDGFVGIFCYRVSSTRGIRDIREYIESPLLETMEKDSLYKIELFLRLDTESNVAIKNFDVYFSEKLCSQNPKFNPFAVAPQVEFNSQVLDNTHNWITLQAVYKANGSEQNIVLGNFKSDRKTFKHKVFYSKEKKKRCKWDLLEDEKAAYYYIDDVTVERIEIPQKPIVKVDERIDTLSLDSLFIIDEIEIDSAIVLRNIIFEFNKSDLLPESYVELIRLKQFMDSNPGMRIKLEGHTDNVGGYEFNLELSINRVKSVAAYLINEGIDPARIEYAGYSYSRPLVSNDTEEERQINRRVAFKVLSK